MDLSLVYTVSVLMIAAGLWFVWLVLRPNAKPWPQDAFQWAGVTISSLVVVAALFLFGLVVTYATTDPPVAAAGDGTPQVAAHELNQEAPNFRFRLVADNSQTDLEAYRGKVVLLNIWATWCAPCLAELPDLNRLQETYRDAGLVVLTLSDETRGDLLAFEQNLPLQTVSGYFESTASLPQPFRRMLAVRPSTYVIDRAGVLREAFVGAGDFAMFEQVVRPFLDESLTMR